VDSRRLGELEVSVVGLGCSQLGGGLGRAEADELIGAALDAGITLFDTADVYGGEGESERLLGAALRDRREQAIVATKFGMSWNGPDGARRPPGSRAAIRDAVEGSLRRLGTDRIDLYQYHLPDGETPIEETLGALTELIAEGKVREIGCSNLTAAQLVEAVDAATRAELRPFVSVQSEYNLLSRELERDLLPACRRLGVGVIPYFPLASGLLTGKYRRGEPGPPWAPPGRPGGPGDEATYDRLDRLAAFARARGISPGQAAIGGLSAQPMVVSVIAGATGPEQVRANAAAAQWTPTPADLAELDAIFPPGGAAVPPPRPRRRPRLHRLLGRLR
jgi:aryl-alcohol dehydrogenase-like predicted oxidoreductase